MHLLRFLQSSTLIFATLVVNNAIDSYISVLVLFVICSKLDVNEWNKSAFTSSKISSSLFTYHKCCAHVKFTSKSQIYLNWLTVSSILCFIITYNFFSVLIFIVMLKKSFVSPLLITRSPKCFLISYSISVTTFRSTWKSLFSSTCHTMVHGLPSIIFLATDLSYLLILNAKSFKVFTYKFYHNRTDSMHPYIDLVTFTYKTFFPFSYWT